MRIKCKLVDMTERVALQDGQGLVAWPPKAGVFAKMSPAAITVLGDATRPDGFAQSAVDAAKAVMLSSVTKVKR